MVHTPKGTTANAVLYTLVESARANSLDIYEYLKYFLADMPNNSHLEHPEIIVLYLIWLLELPDECRLKNHLKSAPNNVVISIADILPDYTAPFKGALTKKIAYFRKMGVY